MYGGIEIRTIDGLSYFSHALTTLQADGIKKVTVLINDLNLSKVFITHPDKKDQVIQADSINPEYTHQLSHLTHLEVQKRKKLMTESDRRVLGRFIDLYNLYGLMQDIQADLVRRKPKLKHLKIELPERLKQLESGLLLKSEVKEEPTATLDKQPDQQKPTLRFGSMEIKKHGKH